MSIGLTSDELRSVFFASAKQSWDLYGSIREGIRDGENPEAKKALDDLMPGFSKSSLFSQKDAAEVTLMVALVVSSIADMIVANNAVVEKSILEFQAHVPKQTKSKPKQLSS